MERDLNLHLEHKQHKAEHIITIYTYCN